MLIILCEFMKNYFTFDFLSIDFKHVSSSLFYFHYWKDIKHNFVIDMLYFKQLRILFWLLMEKIFNV
jgi:hypothetical protein